MESRKAAVAEKMTGDELGKAATNLKRIEEFLSVRLEWHLELEGFEALRHLDSAAASMIRTMDPMLDAHGIRAGWGDHIAPEQLPTSKFESTQLDRLAAFMVELDAWFRSHTDAEAEQGAAPKLGDIYGALQTIRKAIDPILEASPFRDQVPEQKPLADLEAEDPSDASDESPAPDQTEVAPAVAPTTGVIAAGPVGGVVLAASSEDRLVLENNELKPMLQTFHGETELTPDAKELLDEFLGRHKVELSGYLRNKFDSEVERRIRSTPTGQVLVVKIGDLEGNPKPFFSYQPKPHEPAE
jgi:hypothetical protein